MLELEEEAKEGGAGDAPRGRGPRRKMRRADDDGKDNEDNDGERVLRSGAADAARFKDGWTEKRGWSDGGKEARLDWGVRVRVCEGNGSCRQALVSLR